VEVLELTLVEVLEQISREIKDVAVRNYPPEFAKGIHSYTLQRPSIYSIASGVMVDKMAQSGDGRVSDDVMAVLVFYNSSLLLSLPCRTLSVVGVSSAEASNAFIQAHNTTVQRSTFPLAEH